MFTCPRCHLLFALWVLTQTVGAFWILNGIGNVGAFAHLGGAAVGVLFWWWTCRGVSTDILPKQQETS